MTLLRISWVSIRLEATRSHRLIPKTFAFQVDSYHLEGLPPLTGMWGDDTILFPAPHCPKGRVLLLPPQYTSTSTEDPQLPATVLLQGGPYLCPAHLGNTTAGTQMS